MYFRNQKKQSQDVFINDPIDTDKDGNALTFLDIVADDSDIIDDIELKLKSEQLYEYIQQTLQPREQIILKLRYGLYGTRPLTQREIAKKLDISRSYVSRIEKKAVTLLRKKFENHE